MDNAGGKYPIRIIPRLDIKGPNLVKGVQMEGLRVLGSPYQFAGKYYKDGADELIYMDVVASLYGRNSLLSLIERTAKDIFIPLTVGGGIRSVEDVRDVLRAGADKVSVNTAALKRPVLIREIAETFGSSTLVVSIEAKKTKAGEYEAYADYGREATGMDVVQWAEKVESLGAGEVLITSIDNEGSGRGFDLELTKLISRALKIPVIASGGAGRVSDFYDSVMVGEADAVSAASFFHYDAYQNLDHEGSNNEGNREFLQKGRQYFGIESDSVESLKHGLIEKSVPCRDSRQ